MDDWRWFWAGENGRDQLLRENAEELEAEAFRQAARQSAMASEMAALRGDMEARLEGLTRAFQAYVQLDDVRTALGSFPDQARARRWAREDLEALMDHEAPQPRNDTPGYWLTPAIAAMRPDGTLLPEPAKIANERDAKSSLLLWTTIRASIDAGALALPDLPRVLDPTNGWDPRQATLFRATAEGTFGPDGMSALKGLIADVVAKSTPGDWNDWLTTQSGKSLGDSEATLAWLEQQMTYPSAPLSLQADSARHDALLTVLESLIAQGVGEEAELMARAQQLRAIVSDPQSAPDLTPTTDGEEAAPQPVANHDPLSIIRATAIDEQVPASVRRTLWEVFSPHIASLLDETINREPVTMLDGTVRAQGMEIAVSNLGVDEQALAQARTRAKGAAVTGLPAWALPAGGAAAMLIAGLAMMLLRFPMGSPFLGIFVVIAALLPAGLALSRQRDAKQALEDREFAAKELDAQVSRETERLRAQLTAQNDQLQSHAQRALALRNALPGPKELAPATDQTA